MGTATRMPGEVGGDHALDYVSPQIEEVFGYSPGEVVADPDHWTKMLHPHNRRWVLAEDRRTGEAGDPFAPEYRMFARNGRVVWLRDEAMLVRDEGGHPLHWQGFMLDVTKRKKAEERLSRSEGLEVGLEEALGDERRPLGHAREVILARWEVRTPERTRSRYDGNGGGRAAGD